MDGATRVGSLVLPPRGSPLKRERALEGPIGHGEAAMREPLIITYAKLLKQHGSPNAACVREFRRANVTNRDFLRRAEVVERLLGHPPPRREPQ